MQRKRWLGWILVVLTSVLGWSGYRVVRQSALNHALITASGAGDPSRVLALLHRGADPNAREEQTPETGWRHLLNIFSRHKKTAVYIYALSQAIPSGIASDSFDANRFETVRILLEHGANPNLLLPDETPVPLRLWPYKLDGKLLTLLLQHGADPNTVNADGQSMLMLAVDLQQPLVVQAVLNHGAKPNYADRAGKTALIWAAHHGDLATIQVLLAFGADVNHKDQEGHSALTYAIIYDPSYRVNMERLLKSRKMTTSTAYGDYLILFRQVEKEQRRIENRKQQKMLDTLLDAGADVNALDRQSCTPFLFALSETKDTARSILLRGMDLRPRINVTSMLAHGADVRRAIPAHDLERAISWEMYADSGGKGFYETPGTTPLMFAAVSQDAEVVRKMLVMGADVNARDAAGKTALYYSETCYAPNAANALKIRTLLLHAGAHR